jgi:Tfp pilus assembly protein PilF
MHPTAHVFSQIGMVYGKTEKWVDALTALAKAEKLDPNDVDIYVYRGKVYAKTNQLVYAVQEYRRALSLDPDNAQARQDLQVVERQLRANRGKQ